VTKLYYAIAQGALPLGEGAIDAPIGRRGDSIIGRCVTPEGKPSRTEYTIIREENGLSLAACVPVTGRTHQIRVHFASIGHPLAGDLRRQPGAHWPAGAALRPAELYGACIHPAAGWHPGGNAFAAAHRHGGKPAAAGYGSALFVKTA